MGKKKHQVNMTEEEHQEVELTTPVEPDKFDRHMRMARKNDVRSRKKVFISQSRAARDKDEQTDGIKSSIY